MNARPAIHFLTLIAIGTQHLKIGGEVATACPFSDRCQAAFWALHLSKLLAIHLRWQTRTQGLHDPSFRRSVSFPHLLQYLVDSKEITSLPYGHRLPTTLAIHSPQLPQASQIELGNVGR